MPSRHLARIRAMQALFAYRFQPQEEPLSLLKKDLKNQPAENMDLELAKKLLKTYTKHKEKIDKIIQIAAPEWPLKKINTVDLAILRLAVSELLYLEETPPKVAIDEAVEIAKQFGNESSHRFVNGVLGTIYRESPRYEEEKTEN
ncbi:transcription antitermination factor NusB [bacterium]|nr:transcription antitermination factor NusB [bacterium]